MVNRLGILALAPIFAAVTFGGVYLFFYQGGYDPPAAADIPLQQVSSPRAPVGALVDSPTAQVRGGLLLVDTLHDNGFTEGEIVAFRSRIAGRGYDVELTGGGFGAPDEDQRLLRLEEALRDADSFMVVLPEEGYSQAEAALVERFVGKGGKLLLVSDPTRPQRINTLAKRFGLDFQPDYLYNLEEYDLNFRNILVREFQPDRLTTGLDAIGLYTAGSVRSSGPGLAFADANTRSSLLEADEVLHPIAWGSSRNVLAVADFTFLVPPHDSLLDNDRLVSNIADYLTTSEREYDLGDFPHFYDVGPDEGVDILLGQQGLWSIGVELRAGLSTYGLPSRVRGAEDVSRNTVFLGLYEDALQVDRYLQAAGVRVDDTLGTPFASDLDLDGTSVTVLDRDQDRYVLVILADVPENLAGAIDRLLSGEFRDSLVSDFVGVNS